MITDPTLIANYQAKFNELFVDKVFGTKAKVGAKTPTLTIGNVSVENYFSPIDKVMDKIVAKINAEEKTTFLLVEQNANVALSIAHFGYIMENGRIVLEGDPEKLKSNEDVREFYLGGGKKDYKAVKSYRRRKRWLS